MKRILIIIALIIYILFKKEKPVKTEVKSKPCVTCIDAISAGAKLSKADAG